MSMLIMLTMSGMLILFMLMNYVIKLTEGKKSANTKFVKNFKFLKREWCQRHIYLNSNSVIKTKSPQNGQNLLWIVDVTQVKSLFF